MQVAAQLFTCARGGFCLDLREVVKTHCTFDRCNMHPASYLTGILIPPQDWGLSYTYLTPISSCHKLREAQHLRSKSSAVGQLLPWGAHRTRAASAAAHVSHL